jgi:hypothetical protein
MPVKKTFALATIALIFAACSSSGSSTTPAPAPAPAPAAGAPAAGVPGNIAADTIIPTEILVSVINNRIPPAQVTVFVTGPSIGRQILGDVPINQSKAFTFKAGNLNGDFFLVAQGAGGGEIRSQRFNLTPTLRFVQWQMDVNSIVQYATPK